MVRRETLRKDHDVPRLLVAFLLSTIFFSSGGFDMEQTPPRLVIRSPCTSIQIALFWARAPKKYDEKTDLPYP